MKLKSNPAATALASPPVTQSSGASLSSLAPEPDDPFSPPAPPAAVSGSELFAGFVRKMVSRVGLAPVAAENATNVINGTVVAQARLDGVRYLMVRCEPKPGEALLSLSPRERDIVNLITKGYPNKTIADLLDISAWTVGTHLRRIFAKLSVTSRAAMVARYLHHVGE